MANNLAEFCSKYLTEEYDFTLRGINLKENYESILKELSEFQGVNLIVVDQEKFYIDKYENIYPQLKGNLDAAFTKSKIFNKDVLKEWHTPNSFTFLYLISGNAARNEGESLGYFEIEVVYATIQIIAKSNIKYTFIPESLKKSEVKENKYWLENFDSFTSDDGENRFERHYTIKINSNFIGSSNLLRKAIEKTINKLNKKLKKESMNANL